MIKVFLLVTWISMTPVLGSFQAHVKVKDTFDSLASCVQVATLYDNLQKERNENFYSYKCTQIGIKE